MLWALPFLSRHQFIRAVRHPFRDFGPWLRIVPSGICGGDLRLWVATGGTPMLTPNKGWLPPSRKSQL